MLAVDADNDQQGVLAVGAVQRGSVMGAVGGRAVLWTGYLNVDGARD